MDLRASVYDCEDLSNSSWLHDTPDILVLMDAGICQVVDRGQHIFGARLKGRRHNMFHIFHFLQSHKVFEVISPFL